MNAVAFFWVTANWRRSATLSVSPMIRPGMFPEIVGIQAKIPSLTGITISVSVVYAVSGFDRRFRGLMS